MTIRHLNQSELAKRWSLSARTRVQLNNAMKRAAGFDTVYLRHTITIPPEGRLGYRDMAAGWVGSGVGLKMDFAILVLMTAAAVVVRCASGPQGTRNRIEGHRSRLRRWSLVRTLR